VCLLPLKFPPEHPTQFVHVRCVRNLLNASYLLAERTRPTFPEIADPPSELRRALPGCEAPVAGKRAGACVSAGVNELSHVAHGNGICGFRLWRAIGAGFVKSDPYGRD
jgi:hypothetical protein